MESKKINQLATELSPALDDLTIIGDPTTGISRKITLSQMASLFTGTVEEYASLAAFPLVGTADTIYIALDTNVLYRWNGSAYVELSPNIVSSLVFNDSNGFDGTITLVGSVATLTITTALTLGSLPFIGASGALTQDNNNLFYDDTNNRLGIGTNAPTTPLDVFGSGIIARINGTSTNNGFLGFASAGSNKWSVGNVQSDHRFRIFSEANTSELVSLLQTGEFGIGIANPTTKLHLDGGATALIANLDANVSVAKSISFRSDNSNRINLEVSGTESGSNVGADFFIRRYTDLGALIDTPITITRSTGLITLATALAGLSASFTASITPLILKSTSATTMYTEWYYNTSTLVGYIGNGTGILTGANASDFIFRSEADFVVATGGNNRRLTISSAGVASFTGDVIVPYNKSFAFNSISNQYISADASNLYLGAANLPRLTISTSGAATFSSSATAQSFIPSGATIPTNGMYLSGTNTLAFSTNSTNRVSISSIGTVTATPFLGNGFVAGVSGTSIAFLSSLATTFDYSGYWIVAGNVAGTITHPTNTTTNYNTSSDYRLKENISPLKGGIEAILKLKPVTGNYINDETKTNIPMFIAHEVQEVIPIAVTGQKDAMKINKETGIEEMDIQQLDAAKLIPHMVKAIQEQQAQIQELKALIN